MMAFLAMMLMMFFSLSQNEAIVLSQKEAASIELEVMAHGALRETMQFLAQPDFDQRTEDGTVTRENQNLSALTPPEEFPNPVSSKVVIISGERFYLYGLFNKGPFFSDSSCLVGA